MTCHFCSSVIRVVEFLLVSSFTSVSQHSSPSLVHFKLFYVSTVWFTLFLSHKHQNQSEIQFLLKCKVFPLTVSDEYFLQKWGKVPEVSQNFLPNRHDLHITYSIPIVCFIIHYSYEVRTTCVLSPLKRKHST